MMGLSVGFVLALDVAFHDDVPVSPERWAALHEEITAGR
jgi:hypothetical protein